MPENVLKMYSLLEIIGVCFLENDAILFNWRRGWEIKITDWPSSGDYYSLFSAQCDEIPSGERYEYWVCVRHICVSECCDCASCSLYCLLKSRRKKKQNKQDFDAIAALKGTRRAASHQWFQSHNSRQAETHSEPGFTAGCRSLVRLCERVCERKHAEPEGGCEKAVDAEPTGT